MSFDKESDFEKALIDLLKTKGWENQVLKYPTEKDLIQNWANILFENNRGIDRLNDYPLTDTEMQQILEQVNLLKTPIQLNGFINGGSVSIRRDNENDKAHFGKEVSLKIYERREIAAGQSRYQIAQQPVFATKSKVLNDRRGDLMLLINGMPVIHIELKRSGAPVSQATNQIEKYAGEGIFTGIFSLVQIFVAMNPEETLYFANPGPEGVFNSSYFFHWADFNNEPINDWKVIGSTLLSIPMAHQLIGFYTIADDTDGILKVMRSYQYYAANAISDKVSKLKWGENDQLGGYIWHTTGSGKTMTSFKSAQLIATSKDADKVVFLMDRIELGTQSLKEYRNFAGAGLTEEQKKRTVQETEDTHVLVGKLKSTDPADTLIVTSIQKMSNISVDNENLKLNDIGIINEKRLVFIVDECHRSTFGEMLLTIKNTFRRAVFFGFTGTPIQDENQKKMNTTATVFGNELHRYSIADGIRDKNVLGFDPYKVMTFKDKDVRLVVALEQAKALTVEEAMASEEKKTAFMHFMNQVPMAGGYGPDGRYTKGIEEYLPSAQYRTDEHQDMVVADIVENFVVLSQCKKFHAIFATSSILEAITYYKKLKAADPYLKVSTLFDPSIDNNGGAKVKEEALVEIIDDYNKRYKQDYTIASFQKMKKDIAARLAHKKPYERIDRDKDKQIDLLIVVDQMLTGFDSKWINTLYLDKMLRYEGIIQAFSRTNRLFGNDKPFGTIKYYRRPHTMENSIEAAVKLYSGDKPLGLFVDRLKKNLLNINRLFEEIGSLFASAGIQGFEKLPDDFAERGKFAKLFIRLNAFIEAARIQGLRWDIQDYQVEDEKTGTKETIHVALDETTYLILVIRYKELFDDNIAGTSSSAATYDLDGYITTIDTEKIDTDYMNSRFTKYLKILHSSEATMGDLAKAEDELHQTFATLSQQEQKYANLFLHDIQSGDVDVVPGKLFRDYIVDYETRAKNDQVHVLAAYVLGLDEKLLRKFMDQQVTEENINEFGRFDQLKNTMRLEVASEYFQRITGKKMPLPMINIKSDKLLRDFILRGGYEIEIDYVENKMESAFHDQDVKTHSLNLGRWVYYYKGNIPKLDSKRIGKWMYFFKDIDHAKEMCIKAIDTKVTVEAKHSVAIDPESHTGLACFYCHGDDTQAHKRIIQFLLDNDLIQKKKNGSLYNISFKFDEQTDNNEYGADFSAKICLADFIDLETGEWVV